MEDMSLNNRDFSLAKDIGMLLSESRGIDVLVMDMRPLGFWTDYFVIATVTSSTHLSGLERHIKDFASENDLEILRRSSRPAAGAEQNYGEWCLLDLGNIVIHLMTANTRSFFELERLWGMAPVIYAGDSHSSKSSKSTSSS